MLSFWFSMNERNQGSSPYPREQVLQFFARHEQNIMATKQYDGNQPLQPHTVGKQLAGMDKRLN